MERSAPDVMCPNCASGYDIPARILPKSGVKTQKMRCFRCKAVFTVQLKSDDSIATEQTHLAIPPMVDRNRRFAHMPPPPPRQVRKRSDRQPHIAFANTIFDQTPQIHVESRERTRSDAPVVIDSSDTYTKPKNIWISMSMMGIVFLSFVSVLMFWFSRGEGEIELDEPAAEQVEIVVPDVAEAAVPATPSASDPQMPVTVIGSYKFVARGNEPILIVDGRVFNSTDDNKTQIVVEGQILDKDGNVKYTTTAPCGILHRNKDLKKTPRESIEKLYSPGGKPFTCSVKSGGRKKYQLIFDRMPEDFSDEYSVKVRVAASCDKSEATCSHSV